MIITSKNVVEWFIDTCRKNKEKGLDVILHHRGIGQDIFEIHDRKYGIFRVYAHEQKIKIFHTIEKISGIPVPEPTTTYKLTEHECQILKKEFFN